MLCLSVSPKLWQGLLTLPLRRPKVSNPDPAGDLRSGRAPGTGWAVWRPAPNSRLRNERAFGSEFPSVSIGSNEMAVTWGEFVHDQGDN
jgi:hypothetical protein